MSFPVKLKVVNSVMTTPSPFLQQTFRLKSTAVICAHLGVGFLIFKLPQKLVPSLFGICKPREKY